MEDLQQPLDPTIRRRKLDELFADEPYLSPTMKARSLHQKLEQAHGKPGAHADLTLLTGLPPSPEPRLSRPDMARPLAVEAAPPRNGAAVEPPRPHRLLSLIEAAACLRQSAVGKGKAPGPDSERLRRFRENVLLKWLSAAPGREKKG